MIVLVLNCGSSSIKYQLYEMPGRQALAKGRVERINEQGSNLEQYADDHKVSIERPVADHGAAMQLVIETLVESESTPLKSLRDIGAVGHRVVHGGEEFNGSVVINEEVLDAIERYADLAPLHNPPNLTGIRVARQALPDVPQIACFDTAFHTSIPPIAYTYALPFELYEKFGIRRYGFHGTSHRWVIRRAAQMLGVHKHAINCISCHLGNGCSITAAKAGRSVDTSMGLTPLEGLVMGTRSGDIDPAILFYLVDKGYDIDELNTMCNKQSGLLGISGISNDMRELSEQAQLGEPRAALAIDIFCYRLKKYIGSYAAALGRVDAVVFTGGIGENAANVRAKACEELDQLGLAIDLEQNEQVAGREADISGTKSRIKVLVIPTDEEAAIAGDTYELAQEAVTGDG